MANHDVTNPVFNDEIRQFETTDRAHASTFNSVIEQLANNDAYLKETVETAQTTADSATTKATAAQTIANSKLSLVIIPQGIDIPIIDQEENTLYFKVTNTATSVNGDVVNVQAGPNNMQLDIPVQTKNELNFK